MTRPTPDNGDGLLRDPDGQDAAYGRTGAHPHTPTSPSTEGNQRGGYERSGVRASERMGVQAYERVGVCGIDGEADLFRLAWRLAKGLHESGQGHDATAISDACRAAVQDDAERRDRLEGMTWEAADRLAAGAVGFDFNEIVERAKEDAGETDLHADLSLRVRLLALVCRRLCEGKATFYLSGAKAAEAMGVSNRKEGWRALQMLVGRGILRCVDRGKAHDGGKRGAAAVYVYASTDAGDLPDDDGPDVPF